MKIAWVVDYFDAQGQRRQITRRTKKEADAELVRVQHEVRQGVHTPDRASVKIAEAAALWLKHGEIEGLERSTLKQYGNHVRYHIKPLIGETKLARLTTPAVEKFRDDLVAHVSRPLARKVLVSFKGIIAEAQRRGLVAQNVARGVKIDLKKRDRRKLMIGRDIPSKEEVSDILSAATGRWKPLILAAVFTGLRSSELRGLTWSDVDFARRALHVRQRADEWSSIGPPKTAAGEREIPTTPMLLTALEEWKPACPNGEARLVFPNGAGKVESHANICNRGFYPAQVAGGVSEPLLNEEGTPAKDKEGKPVIRAKYGFHALRHFYASWLIDQGFAPKRVQELLGHSSIQMTFDTYGHLFPNSEDDHARLAAGERALTK